MIRITLFVLVSMVTFAFLHPYNQQLEDVKDISQLPSKFFICDSVESTPFSYEFKWSPGADDSVFIEITGDACTGINLKSGWVRDSIISLDFDTKKAVSLAIKYQFALSSSSTDISYKASVEGYELLNRSERIEKNDDSIIKEMVSWIYLPLYRVDTIMQINSVPALCSEEPKKDIKCSPYMEEEPYQHKEFTIKDYFKLSVAQESPVLLFNKSKNKVIGKEVMVRLNDIGDYQLCLTDQELSDNIDSVFVSFSRNNFSAQYKMLVTNECISEALTKKELMLDLDTGEGVYPGDTINVLLSYKDIDGSLKEYNNNAVFEAGLISGCGAARILSSTGELKKFFHRIQQPIKIVILDYEATDWDDTNVNLLVGLISDGE
jgi:hypothetical protein